MITNEAICSNIKLKPHVSSGSNLQAFSVISDDNKGNHINNNTNGDIEAANHHLNQMSNGQVYITDDNDKAVEKEHAALRLDDISCDKRMLAAVGTDRTIAATDEPTNHAKPTAAEQEVEEEYDISIKEFFRIKTVLMCLGLLYMIFYIFIKYAISKL
jgi:hypothetical protein